MTYRQHPVLPRFTVIFHFVMVGFGCLPRDAVAGLQVPGDVAAVLGGLATTARNMAGMQK